MAEPRSERTTMRRGRSKAEYEHEALLAILDAGLVAHVGVGTPEGPIVLPMAYGRTDDQLFLHGAAANALLGRAVGAEVCVTVTIVDGLVVGRTPFYNSMNYRSVVIRGVATEVMGVAQKRRALELISDHVAATWASGRRPTDAEVGRTRVLSVPLAEMSGKVRDGGPSDVGVDRAGPHWGGHVPLVSTWDRPVADADLAPGVPVPPGVSTLSGTRLA